MKRKILPILLLAFLPACTFLQLFGRYRPERAPQEEARRIDFPMMDPEDSLEIPGTIAAAIQLAMDDFRPRDLKPHRGATAEELCLYRRESFDVSAFPGPEGVVFVRFLLKPKVCEPSGPILDAGASYAVDVRQWRILAVQ
jgi:hypothetical protein